MFVLSQLDQDSSPARFQAAYGDPDMMHQVGGSQRFSGKSHDETSRQQDFNYILVNYVIGGF